MGKNNHATVATNLQFVKECGHSFALHREALTVGRWQVQIVGVPLLQVRVANVIVALHLPVTHIHLQQPPVCCRIGKAAVGCQQSCSGEGRGEGSIGAVRFQQRIQRGLRLCCFLLEGVSHADIGLSVAGAWRHMDTGVSDQDEFHGERNLVFKR